LQVAADRIPIAGHDGRATEAGTLQQPIGRERHARRECRREGHGRSVAVEGGFCNPAIVGARPLEIARSSKERTPEVAGRANARQQG